MIRRMTGYAAKQTISTENTMKDLLVKHFAEIFKKIGTPLAVTINEFFSQYTQYSRISMIEQNIERVTQ